MRVKLGAFFGRLEICSLVIENSLALFAWYIYTQAAGSRPIGLPMLWLRTQFRRSDRRPSFNIISLAIFLLLAHTEQRKENAGFGPFSLSLCVLQKRKERKFPHFCRASDQILRSPGRCHRFALKSGWFFSLNLQRLCEKSLPFSAAASTLQRSKKSKRNSLTSISRLFSFPRACGNIYSMLAGGAKPERSASVFC